MNSGKPAGLLAAMAVACIVFAAVPAAATAGTLDQQQTSSIGAYAVDDLATFAQTFTPAISGRLDRVDLLLVQFGTPIAPLNVQIRDASSTEPGSTVLANGGFPPASIGSTPAFVPITFASPPPVAAGTSYSIVAFSAADPFNTYGWRYAGTDVYAGGARLYTVDSPPTASSSWSPPDFAASDQAFKTYVAPEPPPPPPHRRCKHKKKHKSGAVIAKKCKKKHHH